LGGSDEDSKQPAVIGDSGMSVGALCELEADVLCAVECGCQIDAYLAARAAGAGHELGVVFGQEGACDQRALTESLQLGATDEDVVAAMGTGEVFWWYSFGLRAGLSHREAVRVMDRGVDMVSYCSARNDGIGEEELLSASCELGVLPIDYAKCIAAGACYSDIEEVVESSHPIWSYASSRDVGCDHRQALVVVGLSKEQQDMYLKIRASGKSHRLALKMVGGR
jgi:hypothetical protein